MAGNLKSRLARIRELGSAPASSPQLSETAPRAARGTARPACLASWERAAPGLLCHVLHMADPLPSDFDRVPFLGRRALKDGAGPNALARLPTGTARLRFFDLETTGLSGGTGTVAFLASVGRRGPEGFEIRQLFLEDYPGERAFIERLLAELGPDLPSPAQSAGERGDRDAGEADEPVIVTYNGHSFDLPLLATRCVLNGVKHGFDRGIDLLHTARRLWRRVHGGAGLSLLERGVLGREREGDVPGSLVPEVWLAYLRDGDHPLLPGVLAHNAEDVAGLARLFARAAAVLEKPRAWSASDRVDRRGLGRMLLGLGREEEGEELLEAALADGDGVAGFLLARHARHSGREVLARRALALIPRGFETAIEAARLEERLAGDLDAAVRAAGEALGWAETEEEKQSAKARIARLGRRIEKRNRGIPHRPTGHGGPERKKKPADRPGGKR